MNQAEYDQRVKAGELVQAGCVLTVATDSFVAKKTQKKWAKHIYVVHIGNQVRQVTAMKEMNGTMPPPEFKTGDKVVIRLTRFERGRDGAMDTYEGFVERFA